MTQLTRRALFSLPALAAAQPRRPPNIVLIMADDLGWADTGAYGADLHETPHIDRLARQGLRFTQACSAAPVCSPTRAALLTGKFPARLGITIWREGAAKPPSNRKLVPPVAETDLPHRETTLAEMLQAAGYVTGHVGKWHLGDASFYPETQGFDVNVGASHWGAPQTFWYPYRGTQRFRGEYRYVPGLDYGAAGEYLTDRLTSEALRFLDHARGQNRPFFLNLWYHNAHTPIEGKPELTARYRARVKPGMNHQNPDYAAMIHSLDENVGRLLDWLEKTGAAANTIVVFTSDNGGYIGRYDGRQVTSNAPLRSGKGSLYEGGLRVPMILRGPGIPAGAITDEPVTSCDLLPTLAELTGTTPSAAIDGLSLSPLVRDPRARLAREDLFFHYPHYYETTTPASAIRSRDWKLIEYFEDDRAELYNLARDPYEKQDLAAAEPARTAELRGRLAAWRTAVGARLPAPNRAGGTKQEGPE
ncbi:MAG: sulfatase [Acidobacteria bacterium]|nr:sulfatase [Acidobacteriota bacterium]